MQAAAAHGADDDNGALDDLIEQFVTQDVLQWYAQHPHEIMPDAQEVPRPSCLKKQAAKGQKRVRMAEMAAPLKKVKDAEIKASLVLMMQTRAGRKKRKHSDPSPVPSLAQAPSPTGAQDAAQDDLTPAPLDGKPSAADTTALAGSTTVTASPDSDNDTLPTPPAGQADPPAYPDVPWDDRQDRMLNPVVFLEVQSKVAVPFDLDAFARDDGTNALVSSYCSPSHSFYATDLSNKQMVWINAPFDEIEAAMAYYFQNKGPSTGAVFLVPTAKASNPPAWVRWTKQMQLLHEFPRGMRLFSGPNPDNGSQRHTLPPTWQDLQLWYDAPGVLPPSTPVSVQIDTQSDSVSIKLRHKMQVPVLIAGIPTTALVDTGAQGLPGSDYVYVSEQFCIRQQLPILCSDTPPSVQGIVQGEDTVVKGYVTAVFKIGSLVETLKCAVLTMPSPLDVVLTDDWLHKRKAHLDYSAMCIVLQKRARRHVIKCIRPAPSANAAASKPLVLLTAQQVKRRLKQKSVYCFMLVQPADDPNAPAHVEKPLPPDIAKLVSKYPDVFTDKPPYGGSQIQAEHETIPLLPGTKPIFRPMFRYSPMELEEMERQVTDLLANGYIEPSTSPYGAPVLFVKKPRSTALRMCIDSRGLNSATIRNAMALPRIDDLLDSMGGCKYFTGLDLRQAYHQVKLLPSDVPKTAFRTPFGHFQFKTLSFGLTNAPATFQGVMNKIFAPYLNKFMVVYLDDICIFSKTYEEHLQHIELVLDVLQQNKLTMALFKCEFLKEELLFLGHIVNADGVQVDPVKIEAVQKYPRPKDIHQLRSFLGMANFFRRFVKGYSQIANPLTSLTRKDRPYVWEADQQLAFDKLKTALTTAPVLAIPDWHDAETPYVLITDASYEGLAGVLMQKGRPIAYESRKLNSAESNYSPTELEMLAVVHCCKIWRCYIEGRDVHVYTDHKPNTFFNTQTMLNRRQARWAELLQGHALQWFYKPGNQMPVDGPSRHPVHDAPPESVLIAVLRAKDPVVQKLQTVSKTITFIDRVHMGYTQDAWFADAQHKTLLSTRNGVMYMGSALAVPDHDDLRVQLIRECHSTPYSAHPGRDKTLAIMSRFFWWPNMARDVATFVAHCDSCQRNKASNQLPAGLLQPLPIPGEAWQSISMDFVVDLPPTDHGKDAIMVVVDRLTKMVHLAPCNTTDTAQDVAWLFVDHVFKAHGLPTSCVSDRDPKFMSNFWQALLKTLGVTHNVSTAYHPQTDGNTERVNRVMEDMLRHYVRADQTDWAQWLPLVEYAINNSWHSSVNNTPFFLNYGKHPTSPTAFLLQASQGGRSPQDKVPAVKEMLKHMHEAIAEAKTCLRAAQQRQKAYADMHRRDVEFNVGDMVLLSTKNITMKMVGASKLMPKFVGPFPIVKQVNKVAYQIKLPPCMKIHDVFHVSLLKEYREDGAVQPPPPPTLIGDELEYDVERILIHRDKHPVGGWKIKREFLIKWLGYGPEHNTWEPEANLENCSELLTEYWASVRARDDAKQDTKKSKRRLKAKRSGQLRRTVV